MSHDFVKIN